MKAQVLGSLERINWRRFRQALNLSSLKIRFPWPGVANKKQRGDDLSKAINISISKQLNKLTIQADKTILLNYLTAHRY